MADFTETEIDRGGARNEGFQRVIITAATNDMAQCQTARPAAELSPNSRKSVVCTEKRPGWRGRTV